MLHALCISQSNLGHCSMSSLATVWLVFQFTAPLVLACKCRTPLLLGRQFQLAPSQQMDRAIYPACSSTGSIMDFSTDISLGGCITTSRPNEALQLVFFRRRHHASTRKNAPPVLIRLLMMQHLSRRCLGRTASSSTNSKETHALPETLRN